MVQSQKRYAPNPSYGELPEGTPEGRERAKRLRAQANRKRHRKRVIGWWIALMLLGGILAAGYLTYQSFQDEQDDLGSPSAGASVPALTESS